MMMPLSTTARAHLTARRFRVAILFSVVVHAVMLWELPPMSRLKFGPPDEPQALNVYLAPAPEPRPQAAPAPRERPRSVARPTPPPAPARPQPRPSAPPVLATVPAPDEPAAPLPAPTAGRPAEPDLMAYVEARRRVRAATGEPAPPSPPRAEEDENQRASRTAAANLASTREQVFGYDASKSGGVFTIEQLGSGYASFTFTGWNPDVRRSTKQLVEVRSAAGADIRIAVVRRIISIIRVYEPEEFSWDSQRLGRTLMLSSRARDNAGLEDFMMLEFFSGPRALFRAGG
jgi:hypothetical protein